MTLHFYRKANLIRSAETRQRAQRLTRRGWKRVGAREYRGLWQAKDARAYARLRPGTRARVVGGET